MAQAAKTQELENLRSERAQIEKEEVRVQAALKETAEKFANLRASARAAAGEPEVGPVAVVPQANGHGQDVGPPNPADLFNMQSAGRGGLGLGASRNSESDEDSEY